MASDTHFLVSFPGLGSLEGQTLDESFQELRDKFWEFYKVGILQAPPTCSPASYGGPAPPPLGPGPAPYLTPPHPTG